MARDLNRHFSKEDIQMVNRYMKHYLNITNHQGVQTKTTTYHLASIRMLIIKKTKSSKRWQGCRGKGTLEHC